MIGSAFSEINGIPFGKIARLNSDGLLDFTYGTGTGFSSNSSSVYLEIIVVQPDSKILVGGSFEAYNGTARRGIVRLNSDGFLDASFNLGIGLDGSVAKIALQADGKVLVGGSFSRYNGSARNCILRLIADGSLDGSFNPGTGFTGSISGFIIGIAVQPDGKVLAGGLFESFDGTAHNNIARLNANGSLDATFNIQANDIVFDIALQPNGKLLVGGGFNTSNGTPRSRISRVNRDRSLDATFDPGSGFDRLVLTLAVQADGKVLAGGIFSTFNGTARSGITRLNNTEGLVGVQGVSLSQTFTIAPNPAHQMATLNSTQPLQSVRLLNMAGQISLIHPGGEGNLKLDLYKLMPGLYLLEAQAKNRQVERRRLMVE